MLYVFNVVLPVFALILVGYICGKSGKLGESASTELNRFVVWLALPAQLFNFAASSTWQSLWQPGFILAFAVSCLLVYFLTFFISWYRRRDLALASFAGLSASYSNTGYMGIPLAHKKSHEIVWSVIKSLSSNPLLMAPVAGLLWSSTNLPLYDPLQQFISFLAAAASPCALVSIGLFLIQKRKIDRSDAWGLSFVKLIVQPIIAWAIAGPILNLPALWINAVVILSALPTGTGPFMLAQYYNADGRTISRVVLLTTVGSLLTLSLFLWWNSAV